MTIKRTIDKTATKNTAKTTKATGKNTFTLDEKNMILTVKVPVEWNKTQTGLKFAQVESDPKGFKFLVAEDSKGNSIKLFKTGFEYEPKVKTAKPIAVDPKKLDVLDSDEKTALMAILAKLQ